MTINLHLPSHSDTLRPKITVIGVGGAGGNAVNNMIAANLEGVDFVMANTDAQALESAMTDRTIQLGVSVTRGLGAGANPQVGQAAAEEAVEEIAAHIQGSNMVFITAGMGGGTGTGAAPVIAQLAREQGILTVGVVTKPFQFEGAHRMVKAENGLEELQQYVDTLIVIPNQNLFRIANEKTTFADAFRMADEVLHSGVRGVTDLMVKPGLVNLDFADIRAVMSEMGKAMMGTGEAEGEKRAIDAAEAAISNPLLDDVSLRGARAVLINITGGPDMTLFEVDEAANRIRDEVDQDANIIFGSTFSDAMEGVMRVSVVATGIEGGAGAGKGEQSKPHYQPAPLKREAVKSASAVPAMAKAGQQSAATAHINIQPSRQQPEFKRERTAAEIVREAGTSSVTELARQRRGQGSEAEEVEEQAAVLAECAEEQVDLFTPDAAENVAEQADERRKPFRLGEVKEKVGPIFMAPRPEQPSHRTVPVAEREEEVAMAEEGDERSFFQKIAGGAKAAFAARMDDDAEDYADEEYAEPVRPTVRTSGGGAQAAVKPSAELESMAQEEDYLEIPAFLRRQAN